MVVEKNSKLNEMPSTTTHQHIVTILNRRDNIDENVRDNTQNPQDGPRPSTSLFWQSLEEIFEVKPFPAIEKKDQERRKSCLDKSAGSVESIDRFLRKTDLAFALFDAAS